MKKIIVCSVILVLVVFILFILIKINEIPSLPEGKKKWVIYRHNMDEDSLKKAKIPFMIIEDGYKFLNTGRRIERDHRNKDYKCDIAYWGWRATIKNISKKDYYITVSFILKDIDDFEIIRSEKQEYIKAGDTKKIQHKSDMSFWDVKKVAGREIKRKYSTDKYY